MNKTKTNALSHSCVDSISIISFEKMRKSEERKKTVVYWKEQHTDTDTQQKEHQPGKQRVYVCSAHTISSEKNTI